MPDLEMQMAFLLSVGRVVSDVAEYLSDLHTVAGFDDWVFEMPIQERQVATEIDNDDDTALGVSHAENFAGCGGDRFGAGRHDGTSTLSAVHDIESG